MIVAIREFYLRHGYGVEVKSTRGKKKDLEACDL